MFIDRYDELAILQSLLGNLATRTAIQFPLREFIGIGGIGKTALLKRICDECAAHGVPYLFLDYKEFNSSNEEEFLYDILNKISSELLLPKLPEKRDAIYEFLVALNKTRHSSSKTPGVSVRYPPGELVRTFLDYFKGFYALLAFDSLGFAPSDILEFLGNEILFPLSESGSVLMILSARSRIEWGKSKYRIWRRTKSTALLTFPLEYTVEQLDLFGDVGDKVQKITCGHPEANDVVTRILEHLEQRDRFSDYEERLVRTIVDKVIRERAVIPAGLFKLFCYISVFRYFNLDFPQDVLIKYDPSKNWNDPMEVLSLVRVIQDSTDLVIEPSNHTLGYQINDFVRRTLSIYLRFHQPDVYYEISKIAASYYEQKYYNDPSNIQFLIEKIYHFVDVLRSSDSLNNDLSAARIIERELRKDLEQSLASSIYLARAGRSNISPRITDIGDRQSIYSRLKDLLEVDQELHDRVGDLAYEGGQEKSFLIQVLDESWGEFESAGAAGVVEILKHYRPEDRADESDRYDISFRPSISDVVRISRPMEITAQARIGIRTDIGSARTRYDLVQFGHGLQTLLPADLQKMLREHTSPLIIDVNDTSIPWELLYDGRNFLSLRIPTGKQIRTAEVPRVNRDQVEEPGVLLIGVPVPFSTDLAPLQFVEQEIDELQKAFRNMKMLSFDPANDILFDKEAHVWAVQKKLKSGKYKIVHFAGHSMYDSDSAQGSLFLSDGQLQTESIKSSVGGSPLVFLNACQSGRGRGEVVDAGYRGIYASGIASSFIIGGALACIAAIWEVQDSSGQKFSLGFYQELVKGASVGEALRRIKEKEYKEGIEENRSWASYVLFGDPTKRII